VSFLNQSKHRLAHHVIWIPREGGTSILLVPPTFFLLVIVSCLDRPERVSSNCVCHAAEPQRGGDLNRWPPELHPPVTESSAPLEHFPLDSTHPRLEALIGLSPPYSDLISTSKLLSLLAMADGQGQSSRVGVGLEDPVNCRPLKLVYTPWKFVWNRAK
jgi:hypothetical protein